MIKIKLKRPNIKCSHSSVEPRPKHMKPEQWNPQNTAWKGERQRVAWDDNEGDLFKVPWNSSCMELSLWNPAISFLMQDK
jgi:hypothetical protein